MIRCEYCGQEAKLKTLLYYYDNHNLPAEVIIYFCGKGCLADFVSENNQDIYRIDILEKMELIKEKVMFT